MITDAAAKQGVAEALVERLVGNWLKYAPDRQGGRRARDKKKETGRFNFLYIWFTTK